MNERGCFLCAVAMAMVGLAWMGVACGSPDTVATPVKSWNVTEFGAVGDSQTPAGTAINDAIKACSSAGGGRVVVPKGTFLCTPIQMLSNVDLHLDEGAILLFSRSMSDYPIAIVDSGGGENVICRSPIWADNAQNISITGSGVIDGQGIVWRPTKREKVTSAQWNALMKSGGVVDTKSKTWYPDEIARDGAEKLSELEAALPATPPEAFAKYRSLLRPNLVRLTNCRGLVLEGVTFQNSGSWNVHLELCDEVQIRQITIFDPAYAQNGDGIDMESCRDVVMEDSKVDAGDDGICLKSGKDEAGRKRGRPTENVTITRCTVGTGHGGVVIGSEMSGGVRNVNVSDCVFRGTDNGLRFKSERGRGGTVENINVKHVEMSDIQGVAILFDMYYEKSKKHSSGPPPQVDEGTPAFRDFNISQIKCSGAHQGFELRGLPERPLENLKFDDIHINADAAGAIQYVNGITLHDVHVDAAGGGVQVKDVAKWQADGSTGFDFSPVKSADQ